MINRRWGLFEIRSIWLRRCFDLQFESIYRELRLIARRQPPDAVILDIGAGTAPWKPLFPWANRYHAIDPANPEGCRHLSDLPECVRADVILLIEVLEHARNPDDLLLQSLERLRDGGIMIVTVPWAARVHGAPGDYWRWSPEGIRILLEKAGLEISSQTARGSDLTVICNKLIVAVVRRLFQGWQALPAFVVGAVFGLPAVLLGQLSLRFRWGMQDDPLGYFVVARRRGK